MPYELDFVEEYCRELGLITQRSDASKLILMLGNGIKLSLNNADCDQDCLIGFDGTPWHIHGDHTFSDSRGFFVRLDVMGLLSGLASGEVLVCELHGASRLVDRWLMHSRYNDEFQNLDCDQWLIVRRADLAHGHDAPH